ATLAASVLVMFLNPGFQASYVYFTGSGRFRLADLTRHSVAVALIAAPAGLGVVGALSGTGLLQRVLPGVPPDLVLLSVGMLPVTILLTLLASILLGQGRIHLRNRILLLDGVTGVALGVTLLIVAHAGAAGIILGNAFGDGLAVLASVRILR